MKNAKEERMLMWWCECCGMVWTASEAPICRHNAIDVPARIMVRLPLWHPFNYWSDK